MDREDAVRKAQSLLRLLNNSAATDGERESARKALIRLADEYNLRFRPSHMRGKPMNEAPSNHGGNGSSGVAAAIPETIKAAVEAFAGFAQSGGSWAAPVQVMQPNERGVPQNITTSPAQLFADLITTISDLNNRMGEALDVLEDAVDKLKENNDLTAADLQMSEEDEEPAARSPRRKRR